MQAEQLSREQLLAQIETLSHQLAQANEEKNDLEILLETVTEHATDLENQLNQKNKQLLGYIEQVQTFTAAAVSVENDTFEPDSLTQITARDDELGHLARVFTQMVQTIKTRERELATAKDQLEAILNAVPGSISWIDSGGVYLGVNRYLADTWNLSQEAFIGQEVGFLKGSTQFAEFISQFFASSQESASQVVKADHNDQVRYYLIAARKYQQGTAMVSVGIDITERKKAEEALCIAEENYRSIFENALEGIFQSSPDGCFININPAMARIYGYDSPEEMIASVTDIQTQIYVNPRDRTQFRYLMEQYGQVQGLEYQAYRKDGSTLWVEIDARAVQDRSGKVLYYEGMIQDISDRKHREEELRRQLAELKIEIDHKKREQEVALITQSGYFQELQDEVSTLSLDEFWS
ncbi:MAG TPA: hypothetical protein DCY91_09310 [Cyanobacteria bacterium UBA11370]|nr:hypothetical protein [Cyanobacteria bacterium UBA11370]